MFSQQQQNFRNSFVSKTIKSVSEIGQQNVLHEYNENDSYRGRYSFEQSDLNPDNKRKTLVLFQQIRELVSVGLIIKFSLLRLPNTVGSAKSRHFQ